MPRRRTSVKRTRADKKKHLRNLKVKQQLKKTIKQYQSLLAENKKEEAKTLLKKVYSQLDKAAKKKIIHANVAKRKKSRLAAKVSKAK